MKLYDHLGAGVLAIAKKNKRHRLFLASKQNYFGDLNVEVVMIDSGCNSLLLPLKEEQLFTIYKQFPPGNYLWEIGESNGVSIGHVSLKISAFAQNTIPIRLCEDLKRPDDHVHACTVEFVRFHLCGADLKLLTETPQFVSLFSSTVMERLRTILATSGNDVVRRKHALLGQSVLNQYASIQVNSLWLLLDPLLYKKAIEWNELAQYNLVLTTRATLPDKFDDLEDEDHTFDDEEYELGFSDYVDD